MATSSTTTTPLSSPTRKQQSHSYGFESTSSGVLAHSSSGRIHSSPSKHRYYDPPPHSPLSSTTRHDDDPSQGSHKTSSPLNKSHKSEKSSSSVSPSKSSNAWLVRDAQGVQVALPKHPYSWSPDQLALYLTAELRADDGIPLELGTIQAVTKFVRHLKISGRVFLSFDEEDFQEMHDLDSIVRHVMWDVASTLRARALPYKPSRASNTAIQRGKVRSIVDVFEKNPSEETNDIGEDGPDTQQNKFRVRLRKKALQRTSEPKDGPNRFQEISIDGANLGSFGNFEEPSLRTPRPEESEKHLESPSKMQIGRSAALLPEPELVPVLPPPPSTPTDVFLTELPDIRYRKALHQEESVMQQSSVFPVFREPEDVPDEVSVAPYSTTRGIDIVPIPASWEEDKSCTADLYTQAFDEPRPVASRSVSVETRCPEEQTPNRELAGRSHIMLEPVKNKSPSEPRPTSSGLHGEVFQVQQDGAFDEPYLSDAPAKHERETTQVIEVLRTRVIQLENRLEIMERAEAIREGTNCNAEPLDEAQHEPWRHLWRRYSVTNIGELSDGEEDFFIDPPPSTGVRALTNIMLGSATDFDTTRSRQNALILLAGAFTGMSVILLPGLSRHFWNRW